MEKNLTEQEIKLIKWFRECVAIKKKEELDFWLKGHIMCVKIAGKHAEIDYDIFVPIENELEKLKEIL